MYGSQFISCFIKVNARIQVSKNFKTGSSRKNITVFKNVTFRI